MPDYVGAKIEAVHGVTLADDGKHALLDVTMGGQRMVLGMEDPEARQALILLVKGLGDLAEKAGRSNAKTAFSVDWWEIGFDQEKNLTMMFRLPNKAELTFLLHPGQIPLLRETLETAEGKAPAAPMRRN